MANFIGIDVGAKTVVVAFRSEGKILKTITIAQTPQGHAQAIKLFQDFGPKRIVLEATGIYYFDIAVALANSDLPVCVINPKSYHHFAKLKLSNNKTDIQDAALLAEYAERMMPDLWRVPSLSRLRLRDIGRQINRLTTSRTQAKNRLHALSSKQCTFPLLLEDEREGIEVLNYRLKKLTDAALQLIEKDESLKSAFEHMQAALGVGKTTAIAVLSELCVLPTHMKAPQISRYAGLDVRQHQSGTSVNKAARISKTGNAYLRSAIYMTALSASRHEPRTSAFYQALQARGKKKMQALCAIMRKYLTGLWACIQKGEYFDVAKLFSDMHFSIA
jgi:transposase